MLGVRLVINGRDRAKLHALMVKAHAVVKDAMPIGMFEEQMQSLAGAIRRMAEQRKTTTIKAAIAMEEQARQNKLPDLAASVYAAYIEIIEPEDHAALNIPEKVTLQ